ncbi:hypothetical protein ASPZODRAFT_139522 [Penicilliopsis zonata CBS 506.65]|uniref:HECT-type E3 ubiquitin transferase n=1 Tax=Penicilliopsis zonata CBS 506.65 TaxID=1073090 RepID=A0A1L9SSV1_9EURO|nr:hypothetical protein ASPZODRAFT_139522 [Penicilliopsis zonata CBS 506.65]OJJ50206.1 hypothetical protein ASPZODRAFT_139522 [Penicilliopsis zonata CBS 506.65]
MTRFQGASTDSPSVGVKRPQSYQSSKLPPNAPRVIAENTVDISDSRQVLPWYRDERRRQFNLLVRRYKSQVLYGCQNPDCITPTCASFRRRITEGPFRRYTELSARTLACYLASQDNAESGLCCNPPRVPSDFPTPEHPKRFSRRSSTTPVQELDGEHDQSSYLDVTHAESNNADQTPAEDIAIHDDMPTQRMKDPKSFTQNLFDTLSLRMVEWLPLRRSPDAFDPGTGETLSQDAASYPKPQHPRNGSATKTIRSDPDHGSHTPSHKQGGNNPQTPSSRGNGTQPVAKEVKSLNQHMKRLSLSEVDHWRQNPRLSMEEKTRFDPKSGRKMSISTRQNRNEPVSMPSPPALKHRPQKHRGKLNDQSDTYPAECKKQRRVSWDGSKVLNDPDYHEAQKSAIQSSDLQNASNTPRSKCRKTDRKKKSYKMENFAVAQSVSHLTSEIVDGLSQMMIGSEDDADRWKQELSCMELSGSFDNSEWRYATLRQRQVFTFVAQTVFYVLSGTKQIVSSFRKERGDADDTKARTAPDLQNLETSLRNLFNICPQDIALHSLWKALESLFVPPTDFSRPARKPRGSSHDSPIVTPLFTPIIQRRASEPLEEEPVSDVNAAYVATITLFALVSTLPRVDSQTWNEVLQMRAAGNIASNSEMRLLSLPRARSVVDVTDKLEHELGLQLVSRLVRAITARLAYHDISKARQIYSYDSPKQQKNSVLDMIMDNLSDHYHSTITTQGDQVLAPSETQPVTANLIVEWLRTLFLKEWDGKPEMARSSVTGGVVQILASMYKERHRLGLAPEDFHTSFLSDRLDPMEMPTEWLGSLSNNKTIHVLSYPFLFPSSALVIYFRALNYATMSKSYETAMTTTRHVTQTAFSAIQVQDDVGLLGRLKTSMSTYLVLVVRRSDVLTDALNQLWRRERRELMRPLKVQMGMDEGEEGVDHGGVQQEFFRVVMAEALDPLHGMFTMDSRNRISWFKPGSLEPLYKFELLGLLMSLAVYNGLTLPVTFPVALYRKLLGLKVKHLDHIRDGWPELAKGLDDLLSWHDGDVGDIFLRTYEFSFETFGEVESVDMQRVGRDDIWPPPSFRSSRTAEDASLLCSPASPSTPRRSKTYSPSPPSSMSAEMSLVEAVAEDLTGEQPDRPATPTDEAALVTNENRNQFVKDYVFWLTDKSVRAQYEAFARGFYTCLDRAALSIFTAEALKTVVEGIQEINIQELKRHTRYEGGFGPSSRVIRDFWSIVKRFSPEQKAHLLEFVTASDRVPVNGISSIMFVIQKNGTGDVRLPTSLTCFGRLLLPEYSSKKVLEEKLTKALENAQGFGVA